MRGSICRVIHFLSYSNFWETHICGAWGPKLPLKVTRFRAHWHCISNDLATMGQSESCIVQWENYFIKKHIQSTYLTTECTQTVAPHHGCLEVAPPQAPSLSIGSLRVYIITVYLIMLSLVLCTIHRINGSMFNVQCMNRDMLPLWLSKESRLAHIQSSSWLFRVY